MTFFSTGNIQVSHTLSFRIIISLYCLFISTISIAGEYALQSSPSAQWKINSEGYLVSDKDHYLSAGQVLELIQEGTLNINVYSLNTVPGEATAINEDHRRLAQKKSKEIENIPEELRKTFKTHKGASLNINALESISSSFGSNGSHNSTIATQLALMSYLLSIHNFDVLGVQFTTYGETNLTFLSANTVIDETLRFWLLIKMWLAVIHNSSSVQSNQNMVCYGSTVPYINTNSVDGLHTLYQGYSSSSPQSLNQVQKALEEWLSTRRNAHKFEHLILNIDSYGQIIIVVAGAKLFLITPSLNILEASGLAPQVVLNTLLAYLVDPEQAAETINLQEVLNQIVPEEIKVYHSNQHHKSLHTPDVTTQVISGINTPGFWTTFLCCSVGSTIASCATARQLSLNGQQTAALNVIGLVVALAASIAIQSSKSSSRHH